MKELLRKDCMKKIKASGYLQGSDHPPIKTGALDDSELQRRNGGPRSFRSFVHCLARVAFDVSYQPVFVGPSGVEPESSAIDADVLVEL